ncbi:MAG: transposase [Deltaproteobacteria bacterium]|nr:transposase [Deltaproteobacteria bacterium]
MPRPPRIDYPGARHHVMSRGARHAPIFFDDRSCALFLSILGTLPSRFGLRIHAYALMPNHFHLLVESERGRLSHAMSYLLSQYARSVNRIHSWDGPLFRGRFHHRPVLADAHWLHLLAYIHLNPLRASLVTRLGDAIWTSHDAYAGRSVGPDWLSTDDHLDAFGGSKGYSEFVRQVRIGRIGAPVGFAAVGFAGRQTKRDTANDAKSRVARIFPVAMALAQVAQAAGVPVAELRRTKRGRKGNPARVVAAWWLVHGAGLTNVEAGKALRMHPVRVSQAASRVHNSRGMDPCVDALVSALEELPENS